MGWGKPQKGMLMYILCRLCVAKGNVYFIADCVSQKGMLMYILCRLCVAKGNVYFIADCVSQKGGGWVPVVTYKVPDPDRC